MRSTKTRSPSDPFRKPAQRRAQARDPAMPQVRKGTQWSVGMKAHIGVDAHTGLVHSIATTVADVTQVSALLHGAETRVWGDAGYLGVARRPEQRGRPMDWQVALAARAARRRWWSIPFCM